MKTGQSHERTVWIPLDFLRRPYGAPGYLTAVFPALKNAGLTNIAPAAREYRNH